MRRRLVSGWFSILLACVFSALMYAFVCADERSRIHSNGEVGDTDDDDEEEKEQGDVEVEIEKVVPFAAGTC